MALPDREKVLRGLECCMLGDGHSPKCELCPYTTIGDDTCDSMDALFGDALALLKAQEARVMTLEEAKVAEGYIWEECCDTNILHVSLQRNGFSLEAFEEPFPLNLMNWEGYGKEWRYWTSRPTAAEREATPWN